MGSGPVCVSIGLTLPLDVLPDAVGKDGLAEDVGGSAGCVDLNVSLYIYECKARLFFRFI